jgi:hypothetical protein
MSGPRSAVRVALGVTVRCFRRLRRSGRVATQLFRPLAHERLGLVSAVEATTSPCAARCSTHARPWGLALQAVTCALKTANVQTVDRGRCTSVRVLLHQVRREAAEAESVSGFADVRSPTVIMECDPRCGCRCNTAEACSWLVVHCQAVLRHCSRPAVHRKGVELLSVDRRGGGRRRGTSSTSEAVSEGVARPRSSPRSRGALKVRRGKTHRTGGRGKDTYATGTAVVVVGCGRCERCGLARWWCGGVCQSQRRVGGKRWRKSRQ